ncbi:hypothetical protein ACVWVS_002444 [Ewingella americana]
MAAESKVTIARFEPEDSPAVTALILPIQNQEFGVTITAEQQPDLSDNSRLLSARSWGFLGSEG